jgi:hypothetical protein
LYLQRIKEVVIMSPMEAVRTIETVRRLEGMRMGRGYEESEGCEVITLTIVWPWWRLPGPFTVLVGWWSRMVEL